MVKQIEYSADETMSYGSWRCPSCGSRFYGGGKAIHNDGCTQTGYGGCVQIVGDKAIAAIKAWAASRGADDPHINTDISLNELRAQLPAARLM